VDGIRRNDELVHGGIVATLHDGYRSMSVIGHGVDIVDVSELSRLIDEPGGHFVARCFTAAELTDVGDSVNRNDRLAGRFAAKESVAKALGVGWGNGLAWTDIEIRTADSGAPYVVLYGRAGDVAREKGISSWLVSTSHAGIYAIASSLALG
jgi:holo-[acyl-carrier protein] synthase